MASVLTREQFLALFPNATIVAGRFKDNKIGKSANIRHNINLATAESLNTIKDKRDIFFTPNGDFKLFFGGNESKDQRGRSEKTVCEIGGNIYSFIADNDSGERLWEEVGLTPTIINKTKRGYHMYFLLKNPVCYSEYSDRWKSTQRKLEEILHSDTEDIPRILRVPGFNYFADNMGDVEIDVEQYNKEELYSFDEREDRITAIYNNVCMDNTEKEKIKKQYKGKRMGKVIDETFDKVKKGVHALDVLEDLYSHYQGGEGGTIYEGGKKTRGYKWHPSLNYINNFSNDEKEVRPVGGPRSIAFTKFKSLELVLSYFKDRRNIDIEDVRKELGSQKEIIFEDLSSNLTEDQVGKMLEGVEVPHDQIVRYGREVEGIIIDFVKKEIRGYNADSTDIPFITALIESVGVTTTDKGEKYIIKITKQDGTETIDLLPTSGTNTEFRKFLQKYGIMIPDKDKFFILLYQYVFQENRRYLSTNKLGLQVLGDKTIVVKKAGTYVDQENKVYISIEDSGADEIKISEEKIDIKKYMEQLVAGYDGKISIPVFLSLIIGVNSYFFRAENMQLPQVFVFGLSQSGKTTMLNHMFKSFGIRKDISALSKAFIYEKYARHYLPTHFSEYRNSGHKQVEQIEGLMRNLFDGTPIEKGRADQTTVKYESNGLYIFDGQTIFNDDAVQTRMVILMANKKYQGDEDNLATLPNVFSFAASLFKNASEFNSFVEIAREKNKDMKKNLKLLRSNSRMIQNYSYLYALLDLLNASEYSKYLDEAIIEQDGLTAQDDIQYIYQKIFNLQVMCKFDTQIYKRGLIINVIEEGLTYNTKNVEDLKGFIQTINANFLGANQLSNLSTYIDFDYVYKTPGLHGSFCRMLNFASIDGEGKTPEEKTTIVGLKEFLHANYPTHAIMQNINFEANHSYPKKLKGETTYD